MGILSLQSLLELPTREVLWVAYIQHRSSQEVWARDVNLELNSIEMSPQSGLKGVH